MNHFNNYIKSLEDRISNLEDIIEPEEKEPEVKQMKIAYYPYWISNNINVSEFTHITECFLPFKDYKWQWDNLPQIKHNKQKDYKKI